ncbi:MAG TPA: VOC family protein, partial [Candidatus Dormibacteraeota bacterium]|nr:VOC family protein [Candidatus Dormibacteraeota bacterium]
MASIPGIHHVTCITADVQKCVDFYVNVLGLRFIKKSINQDMPDTYHIYFGDYVGTAGTAMTFFGWPTWPRQRAGSGQVTTVAFQVPASSLGFWGDRLSRLEVQHHRAIRFDGEAIVLRDADGIELELVGGADDERWQPWRDGPVDVEHAIRGFHSVTMTLAETASTFNLLTNAMGFHRIGKDGNRSRFATGAGGPHSIVDIVESPEGPEGEETVGSVHHVAWRTPNDASQVAWRDLLLRAGRNVT